MAAHSIRLTAASGGCSGVTGFHAPRKAGTNCPTNPNGSILVFEKVLKDMKVELPKRP
jgi:hypothetical protein